ncbi:MAG: tryptophan-rich sensory protein [Methylobacteriaceae bacterium]|nr:tryptophan-rich sensory protein [Methylobacteriaceae bacterium]
MSVAATASKPLPAALISGLVVVAAATIGNLATMPAIPTWYAGLVKPSFNPPNWLFGPVWGLLYAMMAVAFWRVLRKPAAVEGRTAAIAAFLVQMALNALWSVAFFGAKSPSLGLLVIAALWLAIAATIALFRRVDRAAATLLLPYIAWVSFAALLNGAIWRLN